MKIDINQIEFIDVPNNYFKVKFELVKYLPQYIIVKKKINKVVKIHFIRKEYVIKERSYINKKGLNKISLTLPGWYCHDVIGAYT